MTHWDTPPEPGAHNLRARWPKVLADLDERPGEWARVATDLTENEARDRVRYLRHGVNVNRDDYEHRCARIEPDPWSAWAVWSRRKDT